MSRDDHPTYIKERQIKLIEHLASPRNYRDERYFMETIRLAQEEIGPPVDSGKIGKRIGKGTTAVRSWRTTTHLPWMEERQAVLAFLAEETGKHLKRHLEFSSLNEILDKAIKESDYV